MSSPKMFSEKIREETKEVHDSTSRAQIMKDVMMKKITKERYAKLLARYFHMYSALEEAVVASKDNPFVKKVFMEEALRVPSIEADLLCFLGENYMDTETMKEAEAGTKEFVENIRKIHAESPELLVAHMYVRYLGDMGGGQIFAKKVAEIFPAAGDDKEEGIKFYVFKVDNPRTLVMKFKKGLDDMIVEGDAAKTEEVQQKILDETFKSYELNADILLQLA